MSKQDTPIEVDALVVEALRGRFRVDVLNDGSEKTGHQVIAQLAGKLRKNFIRIVPGDRVKIELSPYDLSRGRITYRYK